MEQFKIYSPRGELLFSNFVDDSSYRLREIMGDNRLELRFSFPEFIQIDEEAYCDFMTERYWMPRALDYVKEHSEKFTYTLNLEGSLWMLKATKFKFFDYLNQGSTVKPTSSFKLKFPITATPRMIADLIVANLKLKYPQYPWAVGECIESDPITLDFNHDFCFDVLAKTINGFKTEWELDKYTLHFRRVERMDANGNKINFKLSYGYNNGILGGIRRIQYDNTKIINRVYIEGSDRNTDRSSYGNDTLLLPKKKRITHKGIEYTTDASGSYLERVKPLAGEDDSLDITKFYPRRVGTVSAVEGIDDKQGFYNIIDKDIPEDLDFSKMIIEGETMTVIFQTGQVAGKEFDVTYNHAKRKFELKPINQNGLIYPQGNLIPAVGDKYAVFHMRMPDSYISDAENEALNETVKHLWQGEQAQYSYRWQLDGIYARRNWGEIRGYLNIGYFVEFSDPQFLPEAVDVRIVAVKEMVNDPQSPEITIANNVTSKTIGAVINEIPTVEQAVDRKDREVLNYARRGFRQAVETMNKLAESLLDFEAGIKPITVQTMMAVFGDESLQFRYVNNKTSPAAIASGIAYDKGNKRLVCPVGIVQHMTLGITSLSSSHKPEEYKYWTAKAYQSDVLTDTKTAYFLYLKASKTDYNEAVYILSENAIKMDAADGYYHFLVGVLNSEDEGDRSWVELFGLTEILPGRITVDKVISSDGQNFLDFVNNVFKLGNDDNGLDWNISEKDTLTLSNATIRKALNVYGEAFIAGFLFSNQVIKSKATTGDLNAMVLDGLNGSLQFNNHTKRWTESGGEEIKKQYIRMDSSNDAKVEARNVTDNEVAYLSSQGVFANRAGIDTLPASTGISMKAAVAALGNGKMDKNMWGSNYGIVGVFGTASNSSNNPAPAYGGYFNVLRANGLVLSTKTVQGNTTTTRLTKTDSLFISLSANQQHVYLPTNAYRGTVVWLKQWATGYIRVYAPYGQKLYDDDSENEYIDIGEGWTAMCMFLDDITINDSRYDVWLLNKFKF